MTPFTTLTQFESASIGRLLYPVIDVVVESPDKCSRFGLRLGFHTVMSSSASVVDLASIPTWRHYYRSNKDKISRFVADVPALADLTGRFREAISDQSELDRQLADKVSIWPGGDLTKLKCDAVVNAANRHLRPGGGICGAIFDAAGLDDLVEACQQIGSCPTGEARITPGFQLPAKHIIHAVGPIGADLAALQKTYESIFNIMKQNQIRSIGLCCISTGIYGFPNDLAAMIALQTTRSWLRSSDNANAVDRIVYSTFLKKDTCIYESLMLIAFPCPDGDLESELADESRPNMSPAADQTPEPSPDSEQKPIQGVESKTDVAGDAEQGAEPRIGGVSQESQQQAVEPSFAVEQKPKPADESKEFNPDGGHALEQAGDSSERT